MKVKALETLVNRHDKENQLSLKETRLHNWVASPNIDHSESVAPNMSSNQYSIRRVRVTKTHCIQSKRNGNSTLYRHTATDTVFNVSKQL